MSGIMKGMNRENYTSWKVDVDRLSVADDASICSAVTGSTYGGRGGERSFPTNVGQRLKSMLDQKLYTDVNFVLSYGKKPKPTLSAHRAILSVGSRKFAEMLFPERDAPPGMVQIQINNVPEEAFRNIVEYLYTDDVYFDSDAVVMQTLQAAELFEVAALTARCAAYFESAAVDESSACAKLQLATSSKMEALKARCQQFIQDNTALVLQSEDFCQSSLSTVRAIAKLPKLSLRSESELFDGVMLWVGRQARAPEARRGFLEPLLRSIRILAMSPADFRALLGKYPDLFSADEALNVIMYLTDDSPNKSTANLPPWCNKGANRCIVTHAPPNIQRPRVGANSTISFGLNLSQGRYLSNLTSIVQVTCLTGRHQIFGLKLLFGDPVTVNSVMNLTITVVVNHNNYSFKERLKIENSKYVDVTFSRRLVAYESNVIYIQAEANEASNYRFLQFDENSSTDNDGVFECSLGSIPQGNRNFFISEIQYGQPTPNPGPRRNFVPTRRRRC